MARVTLRETAVIFLDGTGAGTAKAGPLSAREVWYPETVSVSANQNPTNEAQCLIYVGQSATQQYFRDGCIDGSTGDSTGNVKGDRLVCGEKIFAVWTGGDAGVQAVMTVTGTREV